MTLTARVNGPPRLTGSGLIVLCSYRGGNGNAEPKAFQVPLFWRVLNIVTCLQLRRFIAAMRDHFANPRDFGYQLAMADAIVARAAFQDVTIVADARLANVENIVITPAGLEVAVHRLDRHYFHSQTRLETVVLVYPDALGLAWGDFERSASKVTSNLIIANGRRRLFTWNRPMARSLAFRRFLSNTRIVELLWGILVVPTAAVLAVFDFVRGRA